VVGRRRPSWSTVPGPYRHLRTRGSLLLCESPVVSIFSGASARELERALRPCFGCAKESIQAGIREIVFDEPYEYGAGLQEAYRRLIAESGMRLRRHPPR
jgi:hypothetical protein